MSSVYQQCCLAARPVGLPGPETWTRTEEPIPEPALGQLLVKVLYISLDPAMRGWLTDRRSYVPPVAIGDVMRALGVGRVVASRHPRFGEGDHVTGIFGVQEYALSDGSGVATVDPSVAPLPVYLGALGMTGMTAYFGLLDIGKPEPGQTVVVSAAAGAVGSVVGQIAKIKGCRAVGIAGGPEKCRFLTDELGFDAAIDYRNENVAGALRERCPDRIHVYFDNVGGDILDAALTRLARGARVVICGAVSQYNTSDVVRGPANYLALLVDRASMQGFLVFDFAKRYGEAARALGGWLLDGKLRSHDEVIEGGLEAFPDALLRLFTGDHIGKLVLKVASE
jgi:NADPH-dependent curcumin reductase CurA